MRWLDGDRVGSNELDLVSVEGSNWVGKGKGDWTKG